MADPTRSPKSLCPKSSGPKSANRALSRLLGDVRGATAIEYGLIVALIVIAMIGSFTEVARVTTTMWNNVSSAVIKAR